jgi:hypothetical protein
MGYLYLVQVNSVGGIYVLVQSDNVSVEAIADAAIAKTIEMHSGQNQKSMIHGIDHSWIESIKKVSERATLI